MKIAVVTPPSGFLSIDETGLGYHMALGQYLLTDEVYREYYRSLGMRGHFIIVDNGAAENNTPPFDDVVSVANYIGASEIVLPDVINDAEATLALLFDSRALKLVPPHKRFIVPQGKTLSEWFMCFNELTIGIGVRSVANHSYACIGISKYYPAVNGRAEVLRALFSVLPSWEQPFSVHMLGIAGTPYREILNLVRTAPWVRGIDTGAPVAFAQNHAVINTRTEDSFSLAWEPGFSTTTTTLNIHALHSALGAKVMVEDQPFRFL